MTSSDFQLAQERVLARRRQRDAQFQAQRSLRPPKNALERLPFPLHGLGRATSLEWSRLRSREGTRPAFRVGQVDAELLDEELLDLLKDQVGEGLKLFNAHFRQEYSAEILLALRAILFKLSFWDHNTTYGASLQNLRYTDSRKPGSLYIPPSRVQKALYGLVSVGGRYAWTRWEEWLTTQENGVVEQPSENIHLLSRATSTISLLHSIAAFTSFLIFLVNGKYRTLLDRVLHLRLTPKTSHLRRQVSFEYMNRQLVWHAFTEFLLFVLPLVGINRWRRWLSRALTRIRTLLRPGRKGEGDEKPRGELAFLPERTCAICYRDQNVDVGVTDKTLGAAGGVVGSALTDITNPYETVPCGCVFCFVCLAQVLEASEGDGWTCLRCGTLVKECRPWNGDVLDPSEAPSMNE